MTTYDWNNLPRAERRREVKRALKRHQYRRTGFFANEVWLRSALPFGHKDA